MHNQQTAHYDVVVVGARCAGAGTALLLARAGVRVLVIDKSRYGSDTLSTHALMRGGVLQLARWGVLDDVIASGAPPVRQSVFHYGATEMALEVKPRGGIDAYYAPRRNVLDRILVDAARDAGAEFRFGTRLENLQWTRGRVTGVDLVFQGKRVGIRADRVIGADGADSLTARLVGAETRMSAQNTIACVLGYFRGDESTEYHWYFQPGIGAGTLPTQDRHCAFVAIAPQRLSEFTDRGETTFRRLVTQAAGDETPLRNAKLIGGLRRFSGRLGHIRRAVGPGWALVGDAGYFKDPLTAHGITDALRDAELVARAVVDGSDGALYEYEGIRDQLSRRFFEITSEVARLDWSIPRLMSLHAQANLEMKKEVRFLAALGSMERPQASLSA